MTLPSTTCPHCQKPVSPLATSCPGCGHPLAGVTVDSTGKIQVNPEVENKAVSFAWTIALSGLMAWIPCLGIGFAAFALIAGISVLVKLAGGGSAMLRFTGPVWFGVISAGIVTLMWVSALLAPK